MGIKVRMYLYDATVDILSATSRRSTINQCNSYQAIAELD